MAHVSFETLRELFDGRVLSRGLWLPRSRDLTPCDFYLWGSLKDKVHKTNLHTLEELRTTSDTRFQRIPGKNPRELTTLCSAGIPTAFGQEGKIFSICCSTGQFLLDILKVIITAILCLATFTDC